LTANWGTLTASAVGFVILFQGYRLDGVTSTYRVCWRDLSPSLMRWLEPDPERLGAGDPNFYRTEGNNPASVLDPSGLEVVDNRERILAAYEWQMRDNDIYAVSCGYDYGFTEDQIQQSLD